MHPWGWKSIPDIAEHKSVLVDIFAIPQVLLFVLLLLPPAAAADVVNDNRRAGATLTDEEEPLPPCG